MTSEPTPVVWLLPCDAGPEPASFKIAVRPVVSQGPANAVPALKTMMEQPARIKRFIFICISSWRAPRCSRLKEETNAEVPGSWPQVNPMVLWLPRSWKKYDAVAV